MTILSDKGQLKRQITMRQLSRITLGGGIGTGLFLASGALIGGAGPIFAMCAIIVIVIGQDNRTLYRRYYRLVFRYFHKFMLGIVHCTISDL